MAAVKHVLESVFIFTANVFQIAGRLTAYSYSDQFNVLVKL